MSDKDEEQATDESGALLVEDLAGLGKLANSKLVQNIYADLRKAGATEQGAELVADVVKGLRLFTAPIQLLALGQDLLQKRLERVRSKVPEERQIEALPQIAGPILENLRYMVDGDILTEMYLNLLARAIDKDRVGEAHPAFVKIIEQISPDEALLLFKIQNKPALEFRMKETPQWLTYPSNFGMYISHLESLALIVTKREADINMNSPDPSDLCLHRSQITEFGSLFIRACIPEDFDAAAWEKVVSSTADSSTK